MFMLMIGLAAYYAHRTNAFMVWIGLMVAVSQYFAKSVDQA